MATENRLIARNLRELRLQRGLSLGELARRSGLAKQTLSKIEQGDGNPTVETLAAMSAALNVSFRHIVTELGSPVFVQRRAEGSWSAHGERHERVLDQIFGSGHVKSMLMRLDGPGSSSEVIDAHPSGTLHHLYLIEGRLRAGPVDDLVELAAGDFVRFPGDVPHSYSPLDSHVLAHVVTTSPQARRFGLTAPAEQ